MVSHGHFPVNDDAAKFFEWVLLLFILKVVKRYLKKKKKKEGKNKAMASAMQQFTLEDCKGTWSLLFVLCYYFSTHSVV